MKIIIYLLAFTVLLFSKSEIPKYQSSLAYPSIPIENTDKTKEHFYVQVGAFKNKKYALLIQKNLEKISYPTQITKRQVDTTYYYKLLIGSYQSREKAEQVKKRLPKEYKGAFILWDIDE